MMRFGHSFETINFPAPSGCATSHGFIEYIEICKLDWIMITFFCHCYATYYKCWPCYTIFYCVYASINFISERKYDKKPDFTQNLNYFVLIIDLIRVRQLAFLISSCCCCGCYVFVTDKYVRTAVCSCKLSKLEYLFAVVLCANG